MSDGKPPELTTLSEERQGAAGVPCCGDCTGRVGDPCRCSPTGRCCAMSAPKETTDQLMNFEIVGYLDLAKYKWHGLGDMTKVDPPVLISSALPPKGEELRAALVSRGYDPPTNFSAVYYRR